MAFQEIIYLDRLFMMSLLCRGVFQKKSRVSKIILLLTESKLVSRELRWLNNIPKLQSVGTYN